MSRESEQHAYPSRRHAYATVIVLVLANVMSFIDRQVPAMLVGPIKEDFGVTDSEIALLIGFAFSATYAVIAIPIGFAVDKLTRKNVLGTGIFLWSIATMAAVFATSFRKLLVQEWGCRWRGRDSTSKRLGSSDSFPESQRGRAMGIVTAGVYVGIGISLIGGGT